MGESVQSAGWPRQGPHDAECPGGVLDSAEIDGKNWPACESCNALTSLHASGFPQVLQQFIHRKFDSECIFLLRWSGLIPMLILRNKGSSDPAGRAQRRVLGSGEAPATKGPRISRSVRDKGSSDPAERPQRKVLRSGGVFATKGLRTWRSGRDEGLWEPELRGSESLRVERFGRCQGCSSGRMQRPPRLRT